MYLITNFLRTLILKKKLKAKKKQLCSTNVILIKKVEFKNKLCKNYKIENEKTQSLITVYFNFNTKQKRNSKFSLGYFMLNKLRTWFRFM